MEMQRLLKVPIKKIDESKLNAIMKNNKKTILYTTEIKIINQKKFLILNAYNTFNQSNEKYYCVFRVFFTNKDYITQDLIKNKFRTATLSFILEELQYTKYKFAEKEDFNRIMRFFKKFIETKNDCYSLINRFQRNILNKKLNKKHEKKTLPIDNLMAIVPRLPRNFNRWIKLSTLKNNAYIIYDYKKGKTTFSGYCTNCGKKIVLDKKKTKVRNNVESTCPHCRIPTTLKARGKFPNIKNETVSYSILQRVNDTIIFRIFQVKKIYRNKGEQENCEIKEICRNFYNESEIKSFEYIYVNFLNEVRWYHNKCTYDYSRTILYNKNLKEIIKNSFLEYSGIEELENHYSGKRFTYYKFFNRYMDTSNKFLEYFVKNKLFRLTEEYLDISWSQPFNKEGKNLKEFLGLDYECLKILKELNGGLTIYKFLKQYTILNLNPLKEDILTLFKYYVNSYKYSNEIIELLRYSTMYKIIKYIESQYIKSKEISYVRQILCYYSYKTLPKTEIEIEFERKNNFTHDWLEYLRWCTNLGYDLKDKHVLFPNQFYPVHDKISEEYTILQNKLNEEKRKERNRNLLKAMEKQEKYLFETDKFILINPTDEDSFYYESEKLLHCVKSYINCVAENKKMIFFIRKKDNIKEPYYTMEYNNGQVIQCQGYKHCVPNDEIKKFIDLFLLRARKIESMNSDKTYAIN